MNSKSLIDQLLKAGTGMMQGGGKTVGGMQVKDMLVGAGGGAAATAALGMLLGNKRHKKMGGKVLTYGGLAALGVLAYKAYGNWQQQQGNIANSGTPQTVDRLPEPLVEQHSQAILRALIGAAKADGHIDAKERQLIDGEIAKLTDDPQLQRWFDQEMNKPLDPLEIAGYATTPELAAEMFLASVLVVDEESFMERSYLQELAKQLRLDPALEQELRVQVEQAKKTAA
ncbi:tellurite resistance TerB family protein [Limnobacter parvus]|uniref:Tellurite resistance TerB family protein n=1 Tax=Limnobacter parvus TaxID=2939690 RepID=A0ABT1XNF2_9BURK|nr:tellurite resistance TerB family protein [Limnobacter parvus]MCR2747634.1 tellurite resistance TerB family protein [Limnobacter parvus]